MITGMWAFAASLVTPTRPFASFGSMMRMSMPCDSMSSTSAICLTRSFLASALTVTAPSAFASFSIAACSAA